MKKLAKFGLTTFDVLMNNLFGYEVVYIIKKNGSIARYRLRRRKNNTFTIDNRVYVVSKKESAVHVFVEGVATEVEAIKFDDADNSIKVVFCDDAMLVLQNENLKMLARASSEEFKELKMLVYVSIAVSLMVLLALVFVYSNISHYSEWLQRIAESVSNSQHVAHAVKNTTTVTIP